MKKLFLRSLACVSVVCALESAALRSAPLVSQSEPAVATAPRELVMLRLYDGAILWGYITGHNAQQLDFERLDTGGKAHLPWNRLDPALSEQLLELYGYVDHSGDDVIIEADRLVLIDGTEVIGQIINRTANELWIKTATRTFAVPMLKLQGAATRVQVPALDVFTTAEMYQQEAAKLDPTSAASYWDLSVYCERIYDFAHAVESLTAITALDPNFKTNEIQVALERNTQKLKNQVQLEALRAMDQARARGRFDDADKLVDAFLATYETSEYRATVTKKRAQIAKARELKLRDEAVDLWLVWLGKLIDAKAREAELTLEGALGYLDGGLGTEIVERVTKQLQQTVSSTVTSDLVVKYWGERANGRWRRASYGYGTFLLGDSEARKGLVKEENKPEAQLSETDSERKKFQERIDRYLQNQEMVKKAKGSSQDDEDANALFWKQYPAFQKGQWMLAHYVEHSGQYQLGKPTFSNCPDCGGQGTREILNAMGRQNSSNTGQAPTGSSSQIVDCPTCHHVGVFRRVMYR